MNMISTWMGTPISELDRDELIKVVEWCGQEILRLQKDRDRWFAAGDPLKYMMTPNAELRDAKPIGEASRSNDVLGAERPGEEEK